MHVEPPLPLNAVMRIRAGDDVGYGTCLPARVECAACAIARTASTAGMEGPYGKMHAFVLGAHTIMRLGQAGYSSVGNASDCRMRSHQMVPGSIPGGWTFALQFNPVFFFFSCMSCLPSPCILSTLCLIQTRVRALMFLLLLAHYSRKMQSESLRVISKE